MSRRTFLLWAPFVAALALGFWLSSLEQAAGSQLVWDKVLHVIEFTGLGFLALRAFHGGLRRPELAPTLRAGTVIVLWAISDELHQSFVPGRDASALDVVADVIGFGVALGVVLALASRRGGAKTAL